MANIYVRLDFDPIGGANTATGITYDNTASGLAAINVQEAVDELDVNIDTETARALSAESLLQDDIDAVAADLATEEARALAAEALIQTNLTNHLNDAVDAHDASAISNVPAGNLAATDVQGALNELQTDINSRALQTDLDAEETRALAAEDGLQDDIDLNTAAIADHLADATDAHDASSISSVAAGNLAATDVQSALNELQTDVDTRATVTALTDHIDETVGAHAASSISYDDLLTEIGAIEVQSAIAELKFLIDTLTPVGDIPPTTGFLDNNQAVAADVTDFVFPFPTVGAFQAIVQISIDATSDLYEQFTLNGIYRFSDWQMSVESVGDVSGIEFSITNSGQIQYTSANLAGFVACQIVFRAITLPA